MTIRNDSAVATMGYGLPEKARAPTEMELRCAREFALGDQLDFDKTDAKYQAFALDRIRRVIRAMREPTAGMCSSQVHGENFAASGLIHTWHAMIDAASPPEET